MSYTECHECGKRLWWDGVEYEEINGEIVCFDCLEECKCGAGYKGQCPCGGVK